MADPTIRFIRQDRKGAFDIDHFLTDSVGIFPVRLNRAKRTLTTRSHADAEHDGEAVFQYSLVTQRWRLVSFRRIRV
jgi:hypothetical protein